MRWVTFVRTTKCIAVNGNDPNDPYPVERAAAFSVLRFKHVDPEREQICKLVGLKSGRANHTRWFELVDEMLHDSQRALRPRALFRIDKVTTLSDGQLELASGVVIDGSVGSFLRHAIQVATYVATIGSALERLSRHWLRTGKVMQATIADAIASESAEAAAQQTRDKIRAWARARGLDTTPGYSPGYCGMHVRQQKSLFASLPTERINVHLTPTCLMLPVKSVSGLVGIGPADKVSPSGYPCERCDHPDCMQRRTAFGGEPGTAD